MLASSAFRRGFLRPYPLPTPSKLARALPTRLYSSAPKPSSRAGPQSIAPLAPLGVDAALAARSHPSSPVRPKIFSEFSLSDRVALVTGANRGLGLDMALALSEAGCRAVYCVDLPEEPGEDFLASREYVSRMEVEGEGGKGGRLEYVRGDVRDQEGMWRIGEWVGEREGRMDVCVANAGVLKPSKGCLEYDKETLEQVMNVNVNGVLYTAQAAGRQMRKFKIPGSIILIASMSGSITNQGQPWVSYNTSKSAVKQMARSMACELAPEGIRVNSLSPGYIYTKLTAAFTEPHPHLLPEWSSQNPMGRLGRPDELRGVITWLASDASTFCTGSDIIVDGGHRAW